MIMAQVTMDTPTNSQQPCVHVWGPGLGHETFFLNLWQAEAMLQLHLLAMACRVRKADTAEGSFLFSALQSALL